MTDTRVKHPPAVLLALGLAAGILSGLFGVGGGVILVPTMVDILGMDQHKAQGTSIVIIIPTAIVGVFIYSQQGHIDFGLAIPMAIGAVVFAIISAALVNKVPAYQLKIIFFVLLLLSAIRLFTAP